MSTPLSGNLIKIFDEKVKHAYQAKGFKLAGAVRTKSGNAKVFRFPKYGKMIAEEHIVGSDASLQLATQTNVEVTVKNWRVVSPTDIFENAQVNYDDINEASMAQAMAIGRRSDQLIIDALEASGTSKTVAVGSTGLTVAKIKSAAALLDKDEVPIEDRYFLAHTNGKEILLADSTTSSTDYMNVKSLVGGDIDTFYGFKFIWIGNRSEGGLNLTSTTRKNFAFHKQALGYAQNMEVLSRRDWDAMKGADLVQTYFSANAIAIDTDGIVQVNTKEA